MPYTAQLQFDTQAPGVGGLEESYKNDDMGSTEIYTDWMLRDASESERLNYQHTLITRALGYKLHPTLSKAIHPQCRIADIATGTGVILTDLATDLPPTCQLHGFDLSDVQFPTPNRLPPNVTLHVADCKQPFPIEYHGKYDIVSIRFLILALTDDDWALVARNMLQLLKPGGWLQWTEPDMVAAVTISRGDLTIPVSDASQRMSETLRPSAIKWVSNLYHLVGTLRDVGFGNVLRDCTSTDRVPEMRREWWAASGLPLGRYWAAEEGKRGEAGWSREEVERRFEGISKEVGEGALYQRYNLLTWVAQKPE